MLTFAWVNYLEKKYKNENLLVAHVLHGQLRTMNFKRLHM